MSRSLLPNTEVRVPVSISIPRHVLDALSAASRASGIPRSRLVEEALMEKLGG